MDQEHVKKSEISPGKQKQQLNNHYTHHSLLLFDIFMLQQTIGNQEVQRMFKENKIMAKLFLNQSGDMYEQEADRIAREIVNMQDIEIQHQSGEKRVQKKEGFPGGEGISSQTETGINALKDKGQPLEPKIRDYLQPRFGADLDDVRIHTNSNADKLARAIRARAFTLGNDVAFAKGEYQPDTKEGKKLIAHELTHVLQQSRGQTVRRQEDAPSIIFPQDVDRVSRNVKIQENGNRTTIQYPHPDFQSIPLSIQTITIGGIDSPDSRYAYEIVPETVGSGYDTIYRVKIIAGPGVGISIDDPSFTSGSKVVTSGLLPEIVRVQDPYLVPPRGTALHLESYVQHEVHGGPDWNNLLPLNSTGTIVNVTTGKSDVTLNIPNIGITICLELPNLLAGERYAYQIVKGAGGNVTEVRVVVTPGIKTLIQHPLGNHAFIEPLLYLFEVDDPALVPYQGSPIDPDYFERIGRNLTFDESQRTTTFGLDMSLAATDACIGMIPVAGDIIDIGEFIYSLTTGRDRWGRDVTSLDLFLMGIGALIPFIAGGVLRGASDMAAEGVEQIAKNLDTSPRQLQGIFEQVRVLDDVELGSLSRWNDIIKTGGTIPVDELTDFNRILAKMAGNALVDSLDEMGGGLRAALLHLDDPIKALDNLRASRAVPGELLDSLSDIELVSLDIARQGLPPGTFTPELVTMLTRDVASDTGRTIRSNPLVAMYLARITPEDIKHLRLTDRANPETVYNIITGGRRTGDIQPGIYGLMGERIHDWNTFSDIASQMGPSQRGSMFEHWARQHIMNVDFKNMERISIGENLYRDYGLSQPRVSDLFIDNQGSVWEFKFKTGGTVPESQALDYRLLINQNHPVKSNVLIEEVNYIFSTQQAAKDNLEMLRRFRIGVYYVDIDGTLKLLFAP